MPQRWQNASGGRTEIAKERVARIAGRQQGRIAVRQLRAIGVGEATTARWLASGYLHPRLPGVHAVGHTARTTESDLCEAVLYAGPDAMLSHLSAAAWLGLIDHPPPRTHVSTPRRRRSLATVQVHSRRELRRQLQRNIPVTSISQTMLDLAAADRELTLVRKALARLDFRHELAPGALLATCRHGRPGSAGLRWAIVHYDPRFARTLSPLEDTWLWACERYDIPKPDDVNVLIHGIRCDAVYYDAMVIVELDGVANHHSPAQIRRDRGNDLKLRAHGWQVLRYGSDLVRDDPASVRADVIARLTERAGAATRGAPAKAAATHAAAATAAAPHAAAANAAAPHAAAASRGALSG